MSVAMILLPLFVHVALLLGLLLAAMVADRPQPAMESSGHPQGRALCSLLFATLTVLTLVTHKADIIFLVLAWLFVLADAVRGLAPAGRGHRGPELVALVVLALAWAAFALSILLNI